MTHTLILKLKLPVRFSKLPSYYSDWFSTKNQSIPYQSYDHEIERQKKIVELSKAEILYNDIQNVSSSRVIKLFNFSLI